MSETFGYTAEEERGLLGMARMVFMEEQMEEFLRACHALSIPATPTLRKGYAAMNEQTNKTAHKYTAQEWGLLMLGFRAHPESSDALNEERMEEFLQAAHSYFSDERYAALKKEAEEKAGFLR